MSRRHKGPHASISRRCSRKLWDENGTLDDFYLALYIKNLFSIKISRPYKATKRTNYKTAGILSALLDVEFPHIDDGIHFEKTLLDEFQVANLRRFKFAVENTIPYQSELSLLKTGCIYMEFNILVTKGTDLPLENGVIDLPYASEKHFQNSSVWAEIRQNYNVKALTLHPAN